MNAQGINSRKRSWQNALGIDYNDIIHTNQLKVSGIADLNTLLLSGIGNDKILETDSSGILYGATKNTAYNKDFGTSEDTVCEGNDSRLHQHDQELNTTSSVIHKDITLTDLSTNQIVETDSNKKLISVAKGSAYNKNFGTTAGTVAEGNDERFGKTFTVSPYIIQNFNFITTDLFGYKIGQLIIGGGRIRGDVTDTLDPNFGLYLEWPYYTPAFNIISGEPYFTVQAFSGGKVVFPKSHSFNYLQGSNGKTVFQFHFPSDELPIPSIYDIYIQFMYITVD